MDNFTVYFTSFFSYLLYGEKGSTWKNLLFT